MFGANFQEIYISSPTRKYANWLWYQWRNYMSN